MRFVIEVTPRDPEADQVSKNDLAYEIHDAIEAMLPDLEVGGVYPDEDDR